MSGTEERKSSRSSSSSSKGKSSSSSGGGKSSSGGKSGSSGGAGGKSSKLKAGDKCEYFSSSKKEWLPAKVKKVHSDGNCDLDVKKGVAADKVRARK